DRLGNRCSRNLSLQRFRVPVLPFPPRGPSVRFPRFAGTVRALRLPMSLPASLRFPSLGGTVETPLHSLPQVVGRLTPAGLDPCSPVALPAPFHGGHGASQVPGRTLARLPTFLDPGGISAPGPTALRCCLRL